ncbi:MAG: cytochrome c [Lentisphaerales bacterium]|nr:cytochrome c [Lentisphaerales bacterium]
MKKLLLALVAFVTNAAFAEFGLQLQLEDSKGNKDAMSTRIGALYVKEGQPATPFLEPGPFKAQFTGKLKVEERSRVFFSFKGNGKVKLEIAGKVALEVEGADFSSTESERLRLNKGEHDVVISYESPAKGNAQLRFLWKGLNFPKEPVPPSALSHTPSELNIKNDLLREGRQLVADFNCTKCHSPGELAQTAMPELKRDTPNLHNAGNRYNEAWLAAWIQNPQGLRHSATMPKLLKHDSVDEALKSGDTSAVDLAAYLASLKNESYSETKITDALVKDGGDIFHKLGCVSCHTRPDKAGDKNRTPLHNVASKFKSVSALADFLKNPAKHYKWIRMPDFGLSDDEAKKLSAYLMKSATTKAFNFQQGNTENGKKLYAELGCVSCHENDSKPMGKSLADLTQGGCLDNKAANYNLNDKEKGAISAFLKSGQDSLKKNSPAEFAKRQIKEVNCTACHKYDGRISDFAQYHVESQDLKAHEGSHLDQFKPLLTWMGEKLQAGYVKDLLAGENDVRARPWLDARMPAFKERSGLLAEGLAASHGLGTDFEEIPENKEYKEIGKILTGTQGGLSCVICHDAGPKKALAAFEVKGIDLQLTMERLRPDYYKRWMLDPNRIVPMTKMPKFSNDGTTALSNHLEGDGAEQFMAIFEFLKQGRKLEEVK